MAGRGRPQIEIDFKVFERLCRIQCTLEEIAAYFGVSEDTIERRCKSHYRTNFADIYKKFSVAGRVSLRRLQFRMAGGNCGMAIWLGKQYLGQADGAPAVAPGPINVIIQGADGNPDVAAPDRAPGGGMEAVQGP